VRDNDTGAKIRKNSKQESLDWEMPWPQEFVWEFGGEGFKEE